MDVKKILEYQEVDLELRRHETEIERSDDYRIARKAKIDFENARDTANLCEKKAGEIVNYCNKINDYYEKNFDRIDKAAASLEKLTEAEIDLDELYELSDELEKLEDMFGKGLRGLNDALRKIDEIEKSYKDNTKSAVINKKVFASSRAKYEEQKVEKAPLMNELKTKLESMEKNIDPSLLNKYKTLRKDKILPAYVPLEGGKRCSGCRMELSTGQLTGFSDGVIECESCRRIIYK